MKLLQIGALVSVCIVATCSLWLVAAGYSVRLVPPTASADSIVRPDLPIVAADLGNSVLAQDGTVWHFMEDTPEYGKWVPADPRFNVPVPVSEIAYWSVDAFVTVDGVAWARYYNTDWRPTPGPPPVVPVGASTSAVGGLKGQYRRSQ